MHEHLVNNDLEKQRRDQGKELKEERGKQNFAQHPPVLMDRSKKPGNIKPGRQVSEAGPLRHHQKPAIPYGFELGLRHLDRLRATWLKYDELVLGDFAEQQKAAILKGGQRRHRCIGKPSPCCRRDAGLQPKCLRAAEHLGQADRDVAELVTNLFGIDSQTLKPKHHHQRDETRISW